ncbi:hypothetical protein LTR67_002844 [Exophiala xenobiotica]
MPLPPVWNSRLGNTPGRTSLCFRTTIHRAKRINTHQVRNLWWWSRHSNEHPLIIDENLEERMRRHQKIMRSRYSKALKRKALWERGDNHHLPWVVQGRFWGSRYCATKPQPSNSGRPTQDEEHPHKPHGQATRKPMHQGFDSFRAAVDRAIAEDPYGTLFGRRWRGRPTTDHSTWDPFSWMFTSDAIKEDDVTRSMNSSSHKPASPSDRPLHSSSTVAAPSLESKAKPFLAREKEATIGDQEDYVYDPISMRKVSKKRTIEVSEEKKPFLDTLFSEHGADIPVKIFKPHKVYGYGTSEKSTETSTSDTNATTPSKGLSSSKKQELRELMSRAKGNNIYTTGQFTEPYSNHVAEEKQEPLGTPKRVRESTEPDDNTPLFSGTTYETRSEQGSNIGTKYQDWLAKEGFRTQNAETQTPRMKEPTYEIPVKKYAGFRPQAEPSLQDANETTTEMPVKTFALKLEPALDRIQMNSVAKPENGSSTLQTALDRRNNTSKAAEQKEEGSKAAKVFKPSIPATEEDMDLLRASDVRAATRTARVTKQENDNLKKQQREKLEADFAALSNEQKDATNPAPEDAGTQTSSLSKKLDNVWGHVREYPDGIVAKTLRSVGTFNSNYGTYLRHLRGEKWMDLTKNLIFKDESLSKAPSIYKDKPQTSLKLSTPSPETTKAMEERNERTATLREATVRAKNESEITNAQLSRLSNDIRAVYESEYGPIDVNHRQPAAETEILDGVSGSPTPDRAINKQPHPLLSATVKPGVSTNPVIDNHVSDFEPKYAGLIDATKAVRRELHEAKMAIRAIEAGRPENVWSAPDTTGSNFGRKRIDLKAQEVVEVKPTISETGESDPGEVVEKKSPGGAPSEQTERHTVPEPVFTPAGSPVWNDEQIPPIESLRTKRFDSPYLILAYDSATEKVEISPMNEPSKTAKKSADAVGILARLKHAPEFLKHFATLKRAGYALYNGSEDILIFRKQPPEPVAASKPVSSVRDSDTNADGTQSSKSVAPVLDEVYEGTNPSETPAPPSRLSVSKQPTVKRQENVFSGTIRPSVAVAPSNTQTNSHAPKEQDDTFWKRFTSGLRRTFLTIAALGGGAYVIGFVAEGMGAQAQKQNGIEDPQAQGPRKRIVMTGQRPGIFSTESSR